MFCVFPQCVELICARNFCLRVYARNWDSLEGTPIMNHIGQTPNDLLVYILFGNDIFVGFGFNCFRPFDIMGIDLFLRFMFSFSHNRDLGIIYYLI